ncbi:MAG: mechanosensitive ion channel [Schleiferiaceae bacterium]
MEEIEGEITGIMDTVIDLVVTHGMAVITSLVVLVVGLWIIKKMMKMLDKVFQRRNMDPSLAGFLHSLLGITLKAMLFISVISMMGIQTTSFVAVLGAAGLAVGMALSGTLQNFAGGVMILIFKPFKVGDFIEAQGYTGIVDEIQIFVTVLNTPDNKRIIIPNGPLSNGSMTNYSHEETRRVDWTFGIGYGDSADKAIEVLTKLCKEDDRILDNPETFIALHSLGDSSVNFVVRAWVKTSDYWDVYFAMNKKVYEVFDKEGLSIPFPQMDVHVHNS